MGLDPGFALSGGVQAVVSKREMSRLLPDDSPHSLCIASRPRCGLLVVLVCGGGVGPLDLPQGRQLHQLATESAPGGAANNRTTRETG